MLVSTVIPTRFRNSEGNTPPALTMTASLRTLEIAPFFSIDTDSASICLHVGFHHDLKLAILRGRIDSLAITRLGAVELAAR